VNLRSDCGQGVIGVRDSGIGIAADELPRVFDMFMQVDSSLERSRSGLGIGLTLVRQLIEAHGGSVTAHSAGIGQGSEFEVRLPLAGDATGPAGSRRRRTGRRCHGAASCWWTTTGMPQSRWRRC
jgi:signal transduction histidine kinase